MFLGILLVVVVVLWRWWFLLAVKMSGFLLADNRVYALVPCWPLPYTAILGN